MKIDGVRRQEPKEWCFWSHGTQRKFRVTSMLFGEGRGNRRHQLLRGRVFPGPQDAFTCLRRALKRDVGIIIRMTQPVFHLKCARRQGALYLMSKIVKIIKGQVTAAWNVIKGSIQAKCACIMCRLWQSFEAGRGGRGWGRGHNFTEKRFERCGVLNKRFSRKAFLVLVLTLPSP